MTATPGVDWRVLRPAVTRAIASCKAEVWNGFATTSAAPARNASTAPATEPCAVSASAVTAGRQARAFMSFKVKSTNDDLQGLFAGQPYVTDVARIQQLQSDGDKYATLQWVGYGIGAAAVAGAVTTFILGGSKLPWAAESSNKTAFDVTPVVSPDGSGAVLRMRF